MARVGGNAGPGKTGEVGGCSGADMPAGFFLSPATPCGQLAVEAGGPWSLGQQGLGPDSFGRTQRAWPPA